MFNNGSTDKKTRIKTNNYSTCQLWSSHPKEISGGYCGGVPPLPIPNREVKPVCADGTAMQCGRVGGRLLLREPWREIFKALFCCWVMGVGCWWSVGRTEAAILYWANWADKANSAQRLIVLYWANRFYLANKVIRGWYFTIFFFSFRYIFICSGLIEFVR